MSYETLLTHTVDVYRKSGDTWSSSGRTDQKAYIQLKNESGVSVPGQGTQYSGAYLVHMLIGADVVEGDIISVTSGPGTIGYLFVENVYQPRSHHTEVAATEALEDPTV